MKIEIEKTGRRLYVTGEDTFAIRESLKAAGCHWDPERRLWWIGETKREELEAAIQDAATNQKGDVLRVRGRARYRGKNYYLVSEGVSQKTGKPCCQLSFLDGSKQFWAAEMDQLVVTTRYKQPRTIEELRDYAVKVKEARESGNLCAECGRPMNEGEAVHDLEDGLRKHFRCCDIPGGEVSQ